MEQRMDSFRTPITDLLDAHCVAYRLLPHTEAVFTVEAAAQQRGVLLEEMVKSILLREAGPSGRYVMACVPGAERVAPKAVQAVLGEGWRRLHFASVEEILAVTGCVQGAVAPIGLPDDVPVTFDAAIGRLTRCNISSGDPLCGLELSAADLIRVTGGRLAAIVESYQ
jgi:Cys-tRNA(Pro)/Cys-tRNA(Cys) deacylase